MKKYLLTVILSFGLSASLAHAQFVLQGPQGGTNFGSTAIGNVGNCLKVGSVSPLVWTIGSCGSGGGSSSGGTWSTTTSNVLNQLINYPNNATDIPCIGGTATTTCKYWFNPNTSTYFLGGTGTTTGIFTSFKNIVSPFFIATSSTATTTIAGGGMYIDQGGREYQGDNPFAPFTIRQNGTSNTRLSGSCQETGAASCGWNAWEGTLATSLWLQYNGGNVGIGTKVPSYTLDVVGTGNFSSTLRFDSFAQSGTATSTGLNGIDISDGCFAMDGVCIGGSSGSGTVSSGLQGQNAFYNANGTTLSGTSTIFTQQNTNVDIGTTTGYSKLTIWGSGTGTGQTLEIANNASTTNAMFWDNGQVYFKGNVGIGTTSPYAPLSVLGTLGVVADVFTATSTTATSSFAGRVVTGTTTVNNSEGISGISSYQVGSDSRIQSWYNNNKVLEGYIDSTGQINATNGYIFGNNTGQKISITTGDMFFATGGINGFMTSNNGAGVRIRNQMMIGSNMSNTTDGVFLKNTIGGNRLEQVNTTNSQAYSLYASTTNSLNYSRVTLTASTSLTTFFSDIAGYGTTTPINIDFFGVGIGTTSPFATFAVNPVAGEAQNQFVVGSSTATNFKIDNSGHMFAPNLTTVTGGSNRPVCFIASTGEIVDETTTVCQVSSERYKHDIKKLDVSALDIVNALSSVSYSPNDNVPYDHKDTQYGFVAEQVASIDPHLAEYGTDGKPRTLDDRAILATVVKSVQELNNKVESVKTSSYSGSWGLFGLLGLFGLVPLFKRK